MSLPAVLESTEVCCPEGQRALLHCHSAAVVHRTGRSECLDEVDCRLIPEVHSSVVGCDEIGCHCC